MSGQVVNVRTHKGPCLYVGRRVGNRNGHPLANPFKLTRQEVHDDVKRSECLAKYRAWLLALPNVRELLTALKNISMQRFMGTAAPYTPSLRTLESTRKEKAK